jgi:flagellar basal-body rod protein FlgB
MLQTIEMSLIDGLGSEISRYMDLLSARQQLVASNIANADTPGYKTRDIDFASEFRSALSESSPFSHSSPVVQEVTNLRIKNDGNNVDLDRESRLLAENAIRFQVASALLKGEIEDIRKAIRGGSTP